MVAEQNKLQFFQGTRFTFVLFCFVFLIGVIDFLAAYVTKKQISRRTNKLGNWQKTTLKVVSIQPPFFASLERSSDLYLKLELTTKQLRNCIDIFPKNQYYTSSQKKSSELTTKQVCNCLDRSKKGTLVFSSVLSIAQVAIVTTSVDIAVR